MKVPGKGTLLKVEIGGAMVTIGQVMSIECPNQKMETVETDELGNTDAGIPKTATGRTDRGEISAEVWFDPSLSNHAAIVTWLGQTPPEEKDVSVTFKTSTPIVYTWSDCPGGELSGPKVSVNEPIKATIKIVCNKTLTVA